MRTPIETHVPSTPLDGRLDACSRPQASVCPHHGVAQDTARARLPACRRGQVAASLITTSASAKWGDDTGLAGLSSSRARGSVSRALYSPDPPPSWAPHQRRPHSLLLSATVKLGKGWLTLTAPTFSPPTLNPLPQPFPSPSHVPRDPKHHRRGLSLSHCKVVRFRKRSPWIRGLSPWTPCPTRVWVASALGRSQVARPLPPEHTLAHIHQVRIPACAPRLDSGTS